MEIFHQDRLLDDFHVWEQGMLQLVGAVGPLQERVVIGLRNVTHASYTELSVPYLRNAKLCIGGCISTRVLLPCTLRE